MADIKHSIPITATPEQIYPLIATGDGFKQWWAEDVTQTSGAVELGFFNRTTIYRVRRTVDSTPTHAEWMCETGEEWKDTRLIFLLEPAKSGALLRFTHGGWAKNSDYFTACNTTWGELMYRLKAAAEGKAPGPLFRLRDMAY